MMANPATPPTTAPAIAPVDISEEPEDDVDSEDGVDVCEIVG